MQKRPLSIAISAALATSMGLSIPSVASATNYFAGTSDFFSISDPNYPVGSYSDNILYLWDNVDPVSVDFSVSQTHTGTDSIVFKPEIVLSTFDTATASAVSQSPIDNTDYSVSTTTVSTVITPPTALTVVVDSGANAQDIYKLAVTEVTATAINLTSDTTEFEYLTKTTNATGTDYAANLIFNGVNAVSGDTDLGDTGFIQIDGADVSFAGTVNAAGVEVNASDVVFNDAVDLNGGNLTFSGGYDVTLHDGLDGNIDLGGNNATVQIDAGTITGDIDTSVANTGTLNFAAPSGTTAEVAGTIGATEAIDEIQLNGSGTVRLNDTNAGAINYNTDSTLELVSGTVDTTSNANGAIDFNNHAGTLSVNDGVIVNSDILSTGGTNGTVNFNQSATVNGDLGDATSQIAQITIGATPDAVSDVVNINGDVYASQVTFNDDDQMVLGVDSNLTAGSITTAVDGEGTLELAGGNQTVTGTVGTSTERLGQVKTGADSANAIFANAVSANDIFGTGTGTTEFQDSVDAQTINVNDSNMIFANAVSANDVFIQDGSGEFNTDGLSSTSANFAFGGTGSADLYTGVTGNIDYAGNNATVNVYDGQTVDGTISTATTNNTGVLNYLGDGSVTGTIGASNMGIAAINVNTNDEQDTASGLELQGDTFADAINLQNDGILTVADGVALTDTDATQALITTNVNDTGTLKIAGSSVITGDIGSTTEALNSVEVGATGSTVDLNGVVNATTVAYTADGVVNANDDINGTIDFANQAGTLNVADAVNLDAIQSTGGTNGTVNFIQSATVDGDLGDATNQIAQINIGTADDGIQDTVTANGDVYATNINFQDDDELIIAADQNLTAGSITTDNDGEGILTLAGGTQTVIGTLGDATNALAQVNTGADGADATVQDSVYAQTVNGTGTGSTTFASTVGANTVDVNNSTMTFMDAVTANAINISDGTANFADAQTVTADILALATPNSATVNFFGDGVVSADMGAVGVGLQTVNVNTADEQDTTSGLELQGDVYAGEINLQNDGILTVADGVALTDTDATQALITTNVNDTGTLKVAGSSVITGDIGSTTEALNSVEVGATGSTVDLNGVVNATTVAYTADGIVNANDDINGTIDFANQAGTLNVADALNLDTIQSSGGTNGTVNFLKSATINTDMGDATNQIAQINIGAADDGIQDTVAANANVYATNINFQDDDELILAADQILTAGSITTATDGEGILTLSGGTQTVTGTLGDATNALGVLRLGADGADSVINNDVYANLIEGIGSGDITFNGIVNTGTFALNDSTLNLLDASAWNGDITGTDSGALNVQGDAVINGVIGAMNGGVAVVNVNTTGAQSNGAGLELQGDTYAGVINVQNDGILSVADGVNVIDIDSTQGLITTDADAQGTLKFAGSSIVSGQVAAASTALSEIQAGEDGSTVAFNDEVYADTVTFNGTGTVVFNDDVQANMDMNNTAGTVSFGDGVNLDLTNDLVSFDNANLATLELAGSSVVSGVLGGSNGDIRTADTFKEIHAGADGTTVVFEDTVYVMENTFHVTGSGEVEFQDDLVGNLIFDADGTATFVDGKSILLSTGSTVTAITTENNGEGTLNFEGSTILASDIGVTDKALNTVNFNTSGSVQTTTIDQNIYADDTNVGANTELTVVTGNEFGGNVTLTDSSNILNVGTSQWTVGDTLTTNGATLDFTIATNSGSVDSANSGQIAVDQLALNGTEVVTVTLDGSLKQGTFYNLVEDQGDVNNNTDAASLTVNDGSYVMDTAVLKNTAGDDLYLTVFRDENTYVEKSNTEGHSSNAAAIALATIAAEGAQTDDMTTVINTLEIDANGYGDTAENLATQVKSLSPIANDSINQAVLNTTQQPLNTASKRMAQVHTNEHPEFGLWVNAVGQESKQSAQGLEDGAKTSTRGVTAGIDHKLNPQLVVGAGASVISSKIQQTDFHTGDEMNVDSKQVMGYANYRFDDNLFVEGVVSAGQTALNGQRQTAIGRTAQADYSANQFGMRLTAGYKLYDFQDDVIIPTIGVNYRRIENEAYTETGADALNLQVAEQVIEQTELEVGFRYYKPFAYDGVLVKPELSARYAYNLDADKTHDIQAQYVGGGESFVTPVKSGTESTLGYGVALTIEPTRNASIKVEYGQEDKDGTTTHSADASAEWKF